MRYLIFLVLLGGLFSGVSAQDRQEAIEKYNDLKDQAKILEQKILSPDKKDFEAATRENVGVFRILPRETYDNTYENGLFSSRGGGAYYSFYFRIPDYGYGSDIKFEQNILQSGVVGCGLLTDLGDVALSEITKDISSAASLADYQNAKDFNLCQADSQTAHRNGLKLGDTIFKPSLPSIIGHTYLVRSVSYNYYDITAAFQIRRKDADGSLIIFWKLIEQFETSYRRAVPKTQASDAEILSKIKGWARPEVFPNVQADVKDGVLTLRGKLAKDKLAYAVQLSNEAGALKVINLLAIE